MSNSSKNSLNIVSVTACQAGIVHTYLCAEALVDAAEKMGHEIKVETMGSIGVENVLTDEEIAMADLVFLAVEININKRRFAGKPVYETGTHEVAADPVTVLNRAFKWLEEEYDSSGDNEAAFVSQVENSVKQEEAYGKSADEKKGSNKIANELYRHLMAGFSYIIPFVVISGIIQAIAIALADAGMLPGLAANFDIIGFNAYSMMGPIMATYMAYSIADRPGIVPGMMAGLLSNVNGAGFIGAIAGGYIAGYLTLLLKNKVKFKSVIQAMVPILLLPLLATLGTCLIMLYVLAEPTIWLNSLWTSWLQGLEGGGIVAIIVGALMGWMITGDFGGILCRTGFAFAVASLAAGPSVAMASCMAGGLITGWSLTFATMLWPKKFTVKERELGKVAWLNGMTFIVESGIPFAARDPKVHYLAHGIGGAITGGLAAAFHCTQNVPHGGMWVLAIPGVVTNVQGYLIAVAAGTIFTTLYMGVFKKRVTE